MGRRANSRRPAASAHWNAVPAKDWNHCSPAGRTSPAGAAGAGAARSRRRSRRRARPAVPPSAVRPDCTAGSRYERWQYVQVWPSAAWIVKPIPQRGSAGQAWRTVPSVARRAASPPARRCRPRGSRGACARRRRPTGRPRPGRRSCPGSATGAAESSWPGGLVERRAPAPRPCRSASCARASPSGSRSRVRLRLRRVRDDASLGGASLRAEPVGEQRQRRRRAAAAARARPASAAPGRTAASVASCSPSSPPAARAGRAGTGAGRARTRAGRP